jgi:hypothetical protein
VGIEPHIYWSAVRASNRLPPKSWSSARARRADPFIQAASSYCVHHCNFMSSHSQVRAAHYWRASTSLWRWMAIALESWSLIKYDNLCALIVPCLLRETAIFDFSLALGPSVCWCHIRNKNSNWIILLVQSTYHGAVDRMSVTKRPADLWVVSSIPRSNFFCWSLTSSICLSCEWVFEIKTNWNQKEKKVSNCLLFISDTVHKPV